MPLSDDDLKVVRSRVGDLEDEAALHERYDRLGTVDECIRETIAQQLANLRARPTSFSVAGEYSQDTGGNISALEKDLRGETGLTGAGARVVVHSPVAADPR